MTSPPPSPPPPTTCTAVRKEIRTLTTAEASRFVDAYKILMTNGELTRLSKIHGITNNGMCVHGAENFGGWHRIYLLDLEAKLQAADKSKGNDGCIGLPYWDAEQITLNEQVVPTVIRSNFLDNPDARVLAYYETECIRYAYTLGATRDYSCTEMWNWGQWGDGCSLANDGRGLPCTPDDATVAANVADSQITTRINDLMTLTEHEDAAGGGGFSVEMMHNQIHLDLGWPMSTFTHSPFHPMFYLHHCNVDRLYEVWLQANPAATSAIPTDTLATVYPPFSTGLHGSVKGKAYQYTLNDVFDMSALGYQYDSLHTLGGPSAKQAAHSAALLSSGSKTDVVFSGVDFTTLDSMVVEVVVTKKSSPILLSTVQNASYAARKSAYGAGYCGLIGIFSAKGKGMTEDLYVDCTAPIQAVGGSAGTTALDIHYFCVPAAAAPTSLSSRLAATPKVVDCSSFPTIKSPAFVLNWNGTSIAPSSTGMHNHHAHAKHTHHH